MTVSQLYDILDTLIDAGCGSYTCYQDGGHNEFIIDSVTVGKMTESGFDQYDGDDVSGDDSNAVLIG